MKEGDETVRKADKHLLRHGASPNIIHQIMKQVCQVPEAWPNQHAGH